MPWMKKNPHLVVLLVVALLVIAGAALMAKNSQSFNEKFAPVQEKVVPGEKIEPLDVSVLDEAQKELEKPTQWKTDLNLQAAFVPFRYTVRSGTPVKAVEDATWDDPFTKKKIPNAWFMQYRLAFTDPTAPIQDADGDGFSNADEWRGKTDPTDKNSHPPYHTLLFLSRFERVPFLLKFNAYDGDPKKPEEMSFQINTLSVRDPRTGRVPPSQFLKIGDEVANGKYKIVKFEYKMVNNPALGGEQELSELTIQNKETEASVVLVLNKIIDSPDSFAVFAYLWPQAQGKQPMGIRVAKLGKFILPPNQDPKKDLYQVLDITDQSASIKLPSGETVTISPHP